MTMKPLLTLMLCVAVGGCATLATMKGDQSAVQGRTLAYSLSGTGSPTVVFEAGMGDAKEVWSTVAPQVAKATTVLTYDRAGYGASRVAFDRRSAAEVVADLRGLLETAGRKPPYVLVGTRWAVYTCSTSLCSTRAKSPVWCWWIRRTGISSRAWRRRLGPLQR